MAATAYLASHPPSVGDPKSAMHKSVLDDLRLVGAALHDEAPAEQKKKSAVKITRSRTSSSEQEEHDLPRRRRSPRCRSNNYDSRNELTQCKIDKSRAKRACSTESEEEDDVELCGARCFSRSV